MIQLTPEQQAVCRKAVERYGMRAQTRKCAEELRELADELDKVANGEADIFCVVDERADVDVVLWQLDNVLIAGMEPHVEERVAFKVARLEGRMEDGSL